MRSTSVEIGGTNPQVPWLQGAGRHCDRFWEEGCPNCPSIGPDQNTPFTVSSMVGGPKCPSSSPPLCQAETEWEVNRGLLDDDLEPIDCQSRQIAIVPLDSWLELLLNSFATITCCHVGLHVPVYNFTIQDHKSLLPEHQQHLEAVYDDGQPEFGFMNRQKYYLKCNKHPAEPIIRLCLQFDQMKWNTIQVSDGKMRWIRAVGTKMGSKGDTASGGLFYKSASLYKCLRTNRPLCVSAPWAGWAAALYVAIGTIDAPRYPRYPLVKERPDVGDIHWRHRFFLISTCVHIKFNRYYSWKTSVNIVYIVY